MRLRQTRFGLVLSLWFILSLLCLPCFADAWPPAEALVDTALFQDVPVQYVDMGKGEVPLVLIHGWACRGSFWRSQVPLAQDGRLIIPDLPGHGNSGFLDGPYSLDALAGAVLAVMDQAGVQRAVLAGHSMGAAVAWRVAVKAPDRVAGIVSVDGAVFVLPEVGPGRQAWIEGMQGTLDKLKGPDGEAVAAQFIDSMHGPDISPELKNEIRELMLATPREVRMSASETLCDPDTWDGAVTQAPVLGIHVQSPGLAPDYEQTIQAIFPDFTFVVLNGPGHFVMMERPEQVNQLIRGFWDGLVQ